MIDNKLSNNVKDTNLFLYENNIVSAQYLFRMIWEGRLKRNDIVPMVIQNELFQESMNNLVKQLATDVENKNDRDWYNLPNVTTKDIVVDIDKANLEKESDFLFSFRRF